ncbi:MAG: hypothetical protein NTY02_08135 [Acidobacteria bacterium]|nr:hypothetical protein [Acidobacteriota bacterium]
MRRQQEHDLALLMPGMAGLTEPRQQLYLFCLTLIDRFRGDGLDAATDADVAAAAGSLASTYETATHGIIYEHRAESVPAQRLAAEIKTVFEELGRGRPSAFAADATAVLRRLEARVQAVQKLEASNPRAFVAVSGRVARRFAAGDGAAGPAPDAPAVPASPIIIP